MASIDHLEIVAGVGDGKTSACVMSAASLLADEPFGDDPSCVCEVIRSYAIKLNDSLDSAHRQRLLQVVPELIGTAGSRRLGARRALLCADRAVRKFAPAALRAAGLNDEASALEALPPVTATTAVAAHYAAEAADAAAACAASAAYAAADAVGHAYYAAHAAAYAAGPAAAAAADAAAACAASAAERVRQVKLLHALWDGPSGLEGRL